LAWVAWPPPLSLQRSGGSRYRPLTARRHVSCVVGLLASDAGGRRARSCIVWRSIWVITDLRNVKISPAVEHLQARAVIWGGPSPKAPSRTRLWRTKSVTDQLTCRLPNIHGARSPYSRSRFTSPSRLAPSTSRSRGWLHEWTSACTRAAIASMTRTNSAARRFQSWSRSATRCPLAPS
jgi:hypothetical protein